MDNDRTRLPRSAPAASRRERGASRKELVFAIALVVSIVLITAAVLLTRRTGQRTIKEGDRAPSFALPSTAGGSVSLDAYKGKVVLVHFWATWCPPCVEEMPTLERLYRAFPGRDLEILGVSVDEGAGDAVAPFIRRHGITFPVLLDPGGPSAKRYGTFKFPETYVLDRRGTVRYKVIGAIEWTSPDTLTALRRLVEEM